MGLFSGVKNTYRKSEAAVVVQKLLERQSNVGLLGLDPATTATQLVATIWNAKPDVFNGEFGQRPHKITVAASALANGLNEYTEGSDNWNALALSLGTVLSEIETNGQLYPLNSLDIKLIGIAGERMALAANKINEDSKSSEHSENYHANKRKVREKGVRHLAGGEDGLKSFMEASGFEFLPAGIEAVNKMIDGECFTDVEAATKVAILTMARDIKEANLDITKIAAISIHCHIIMNELEKI